MSDTHDSLSDNTKMFIVTKEIDSENISKLCRTCLREDGDKMVCLFVGPAGSSLAAKLRTLSCLEVWQGDGLPEKLCDRCVTRAESALLYREQCRAADRALREAALQVSRAVQNNTVSNSKVYSHHRKNFDAIQTCEKSSKCTECGAVFATYQDLCTHNQAHLPFVQENRTVQHMNIVESQNIPGYMSSCSRLEKTSELLPNSFITSDIVETVPTAKNDRAACALHCSLCNHTFTNRIQLINHHSLNNCREDVETRCDNDNLAINEDPKIHEIRSRGFEHVIAQTVHGDIRNLSYRRNNDASVQALNYSAHMAVDSRNINTNNESSHIERDQNLDSGDSEVSSDTCSNQIPRFPSFADVEIQESPSDEHRENRCRVRNDFMKNSMINDENSSTPKKLHKCGVCEKSFVQRSKLIAHNLLHTGQRPFACIHCDKAYTSRSKLNAHIRLHTQVNVHRCGICDKTFSYPSYLAEHAKIHQVSRISNCLTPRFKEFECSMCKKKFRLLKNLKAHLRLHTGKGLFRCEICHKAFGQKYNLKVHLRTHNSASKLFKCNYCEKAFKARGNFMEHLRIHTKVKPFKCSMCTKSFSQSSHLKTHEASHNSLRPHQCRLCGKRYKLTAHLRRHERIHTSTEYHKCELCDQIFSHAFSLKRHLKRHSDSQI